MNNKRLINFFLGIFLFISSYAQLNNFDLSKYKLPDLERRSLETNFNLTGNNNSYKIPFESLYYDLSDNARSRYSSYIKLNYNYFLNNEKLQRSSDLGLNLTSYFDRYKEDGDVTDKESYFTPNVFFNRVNRKYYKPNNFIETNIEFNYQYEIGSEYVIYNGNETDNIAQIHSLFASIPLKFGKGRIEPVQDARHAVYIYDELSKVDRISLDKSENEIIELAELISKLKNKRFFDSRIRKIEEIGAVDSLFNSKGYINNSDATYFTTLNDIWVYGNGPYRSAGNRISWCIYPGYYYNQYNQKLEATSDEENKETVRAFSIDGGVELRHEKPINLFWQNSVGIEGLVGIAEGLQKNDDNSDETKIRVPSFQINYFQTISYLPNTRTDINLTYSIQYAKMFDKSDPYNNINGFEADAGKVALSFAANYYISPRFRLNAYSSYNYIWQGSKNDAYINFSQGTRSSIDLSNLYTFKDNYSIAYKKTRYFSFSISLIYSIF